ncbi:MAG TPA: hypothetical protein VF756_32175 [Thermoanaerobaculia bacterium]
MTAIFLLRTAGVIALGLVLFHGLFWRLFDWPGSLADLSPANRALPQVLNLSLIAVFLLFGVLLLVWPAELLSTNSGRALILGIGLVYAARALLQPLFFGLRSGGSRLLFGICVAAALLHFAALNV